MRWEKLNDKCIFAFLPELEPLFAARNLLLGEPYHQLGAQIYPGEQIAAWKRRFRFLFETCEAVFKLYEGGLHDLLIDCIAEDLTAARFQRYALSLTPEELLWRQSDWEYSGVSRQLLRQAMDDDGALAELYEKVEAQCPNFLGFSAFVRQNERLVRDFFALAAEMDTSALREALAEREEKIAALRDRTAENLKSMEPLACAEELMGKCFHNRGPYERFYFLASLMLPFRAMRLFYPNGTAHNRQLLFLAVREPEPNREKTIAGLMTLADPTRYQILRLLAERGSVKGQDVARALKLAPSTVSHHMNALRDAGLVTEEPVKTAKYYGLARDSLRRLSEEIKTDLKLE